jgi:hypothetical protein
MAPTNPPSPDRPSGGRVTGGGHHRPTPSRKALSGADSRLPSPVAAGHALAGPAIRVVVPGDPPRLTPEATAALLRILLHANERRLDASPPEPGGGRTSGAPARRRDQEARRAS